MAAHHMPNLPTATLHRKRPVRVTCRPAPAAPATPRRLAWRRGLEDLVHGQPAGRAGTVWEVTAAPRAGRAPEESGGGYVNGSSRRIVLTPDSTTASKMSVMMMMTKAICARRGEGIDTAGTTRTAGGTRLESRRPQPPHLRDEERLEDRLARRPLKFLQILRAQRPEGRVPKARLRRA